MTHPHLPVLAGLAFSALALNAHATSITAYAGTSLISPPALSLDFSPIALSTVTLATPTSIGASEGATLTYTTAPAPQVAVTKYTGLTFVSQLKSATFDADTKRLLTEQLSGAITISKAGPSVVGTGGSLTISNLLIDFSTRIVTATMTGANGVGTREGVRLFDFDNIGDVYVTNGLRYVPELSPAASSYPYPNPYQDRLLELTPFLDMSQVPVSIPTLRLTTEGGDIWVKAMGYNLLGSLAINSLEDKSFGSISSPAVPEISTWSMMGLGLLGMQAAHRRLSEAVEQT